MTPARYLRWLAAAVAVGALVSGCGPSDRVLVGAGTTVVDSGLAGQLIGGFDGSVSVVGGSTAELLLLADRGELALVIVHDPAQEAAFMGNHPAAQRVPLFSSDFLIVGPREQAATLTASTADALFAEIAERGLSFVSRGDGSGTYAKELELWGSATGSVPSGAPWYSATGQGMGFTLQVADQSDAFTLVERGAFLAAANTIDLVPISLDDPTLINPYSAILVDPSAGPLFDWLQGDQAAAKLRTINQALFGEDVYR